MPAWRGVTIYLEIGEAGRFDQAERLAAYADLTPTYIHASGGKSFLGPTSPRANTFCAGPFQLFAVFAGKPEEWSTVRMSRTADERRL